MGEETVLSAPESMLPQRSRIHYLTIGEATPRMKLSHQMGAREWGTTEAQSLIMLLPTLDLVSLYVRKIPLCFKPVQRFVAVVAVVYIPNHPVCM